MRIYNFSAGPATLPEAVLKKAADQMLEYGSSGMSVMEMSHRSSAFLEIFQSAKDGLRRVMNIPDDYEILFLQGGATGQFAMVPMNFLKTSASYVVSGNFSKKAYQEALKFGDAKVAATSEETNYDRIPALPKTFAGDYLHICTNNTIFGTSFRKNIPSANIPLFADMSSNILSEEMDVSKFDLIYAGAQKNIGPAGLTVVILKKSMVGEANKALPSVMDYATQIKGDSMYNTPPTYAIYIAGLVFDYLEKNGGVKAAEERNVYKAGLLYDFLDESKLFKPTADKGSRSIMNVTFVTGSDEGNAAFCKAAAAAGLGGLKGHRLVGGMRASIYNAMPVEGVKALVEFMKQYETDNK